MVLRTVYGIMLICFLHMSMASANRVLLKENFSEGNAGEMPHAWKVESFQNANPTSVALVKGEDGKLIMRYRCDYDGRALSSLYAVTELLNDEQCQARVRFRYKVNAKSSMGLFINHSAKAGGSQPSIGKYVPMENDNQWHREEVLLPASSGYENRKVLEFFLDSGYCGKGTCEKGAEIFLDDIVFEEIQIPADVKIIAPRSLNLFDGIPEQQVVLGIFARQENTFDISVTRIDMDDSVLQKSIRCTGTQNIPLDFGPLTVGTYRIDVASANFKKNWTWEINKNTYKAESVLIRNGVPHVNGKPYLVLGLYHVSDIVREHFINKANAEGVADFTLDRDTMLREVKERGFNTINGTWGPATHDFHESAKKQGLMVISHIEKSYETIKTVVDYPSNFAWYTIDEPMPSKFNLAANVYRQCKRTDPYHPVMLCLWPTQSGMDDYKLGDIICVDPYPIAGPNSSVAADAMWVKLAYDKFVKDDPTSCVFVVPQLFIYPRETGYEPSYPQIRAEVYAGISAGAKGVNYFSYWEHGEVPQGMYRNPDRKHWFLPESRLWDEIGKLNKELLELQDVILLGTPYNKFEVKKSDPILYNIVALPNKERYVLVVNPTGEKQDVFQISGLSASEMFVPLYDSMVFNGILNGVCKLENLPPYMVGIYKIEGTDAKDAVSNIK